jgi:hypothetical protein
LERVALYVAIIALVVEILKVIIGIADSLFPIDIRGDLKLYATSINDYIPFVIPVTFFALRYAWIGLLVAVLALTLMLQSSKGRLEALRMIHRIKSEEADIERDYRLRYSACERVFHQLASQNAKGDRDLFNMLFVDFPRPRLNKAEKLAHLQVVKAAAGVVKTNLVNILDAAKSLFDAMTGEECAACLQVLSYNARDRIENADVYTSLRDKASDAKRGTALDSHKISSSSLSEQIFARNEEVVIENNLRQKIEDGLIKSSSRNVGLTYNAVCIFAIPNLAREGVTVTALCLDNMHGIPEDKINVCIHFGRELAWRIAVMQYRLDYLVREWRELERRT